MKFPKTVLSKTTLVLLCAAGLFAVAQTPGAEAAGSFVNTIRANAEQGDADAQFRLGLTYKDGNGVGEDMAEAVIWFQKAAEQGQAHARYHLGEAFSHGTGVMKNEPTALA